MSTLVYSTEALESDAKLLRNVREARALLAEKRSHKHARKGYGARKVYTGTGVQFK